MPAGADDIDGGKDMSPTEMTRKPTFIAPAGPDVSPILMLHRGADGFVTFHETASGRWKDLVAVPAAELNQCFPELIEQLEVDSFYSINQFFKGGGKSAVNPNLSKPLRRGDCIRWLTACFADLDCGRDGQAEAGFVIGAIITLQDEGVLPPASMLLRSGRGVWAFWVLTNEDEKYPLNGPVRAWNNNIITWYRIQNVIGEQLARLWADPGARDACRVTRVPGSIHSKVDRPVAYWIQLDKNGQGYAYTLSELCKFFGVTDRKYNPYIRADIDPALAGKRRDAYKTRWRQNLLRFEMLRAMRGGFRKGGRYFTAQLYGSILKTLDHPDDAIKEAVLEMAAECLSSDGSSPAALEEEDCLAAFEAVKKQGSMRHQTIADRLGVTPDESKALATLPGQPWPPASKYSSNVDDALPQLSQAEKRERRQSYIREWHEGSGGEIITYRAMQDILAEVGLSASLKTILDDYRALGLAQKNPRAKRRDKDGQPSLF